MSLDAFRAFYDERPDGERWELIDGQPVVTPPPTILHQKIVANLQRLLDIAATGHGGDLVAIPAPGVELALTADAFRALGKGAAYAPEPDVAVIRDTDDPKQRYARSVVLFAEVVSSTDAAVHAEGQAWIDVKAALYRAHRDCQAVLVIEQDRIGVHLWQRSQEGWTETRLAGLDDELAIACCGLRCRVADVYLRTHLGRRPEP